MALLACEETIFEPDISEESVQLLAPANGSVVNTESVQFNWEGVEGATSYRIQIANPDFENASQILVDSTTDVLSFSERITPGSYQWRVRAQNDGHQTLYTTASFSVE